MIFAHDAEQRVRVLVDGMRPFVNEVVVCDIGSADGTAVAARSAGATVIERDLVPVVEMVRQEVVDTIEARWILILDDDEVPDTRLLTSLAAIIESDAADVVAVPLLTYFFGEPLRHAGYSPTNPNHSQVRMFKKGTLRAPTRIHQKLTYVDSARYLRLTPEAGHLNHFSYDSVSQWLQKVDRYTDAEAEWIATNLIGRRWASFLFVARSVLEPISLVLRHRAFSGGWRGRAMVVFMLNYRVASWAKAKEISEGYGPAVVREKYLRAGRDALGRTGNADDLGEQPS